MARKGYHEDGRQITDAEELAMNAPKEEPKQQEQKKDKKSKKEKYDA